MTFKKTNASKPSQKSAEKTAQKSASEPTNKRTSPTPSSVPGAVSGAVSAAEPATVLVHDLIGSAVIALPLELKAIVGDEAFKDLLAELENHVMTVIIRRPGHIIYVDAQFMAPDLSADLKTQGPGLDRTSSDEGSPATNPSGTPKPPSKKAGKSAGHSPKSKA